MTYAIDWPWCACVDEEGDVYHSYPRFGRKHDLEHGGDCWCHPRIEKNENGIAVFHEVEQ